MDMPSFLYRDGNSLKFSDSGYIAFYIPEMFFERDFAIIDGEYVHILGIFNYALFDSANKPKSKLLLFRFETMISCMPSKIEKIKAVKLTANSDEEDYRVLKFFKDDIVICNTKVPMDVTNVEAFIKMHTTGKLPNTIPYKELHELYLQNIALNGDAYPVSAQLLGIIVSETARDPKDVTMPYRLSKNKSAGYKLVSIKDIPKLISPFTSLTSENWDESIVNAIVNDDKGYKESPLERLMTQ